MPKCPICKDKYERVRNMQLVCDKYQCALAYAKKAEEKKKLKADKKFKAETRRLKEKIKKRGEWLAEAQKEFNKYIRKRDEGDSCISCGRSSGCKVNAGHYKSVGAYPELRFNEDNVHLQCEHCNCHKSGNAIEYRARLVEKIGIERVEKLEGPQAPLKLTIEDIKEIKNRYKLKYKELIKGR